MKRWWNDLDFDDFYTAFGIILIFICLSASIALFGYTFSTKKFVGYYPHRYSDTYQIYINWENAPDEMVFSSTNLEEFLVTYERLKKIDSK